MFRGDLPSDARWTTLSSGNLLTIIAVLLVIVVAAPPPSPLHLSYVTSDSMEPTLSPADGYFIVGGTTIETGDVVTFYAPSREMHVTHRVVGQTDGGFVTKGDANPSTDQAGGAPPVERSQILGEVVTVGGHVLAIPGLGVLAGALSTPWAGAGALAAFLLWFALRAGGPPVPPRAVTHVREIAVPVVVTLALAGVIVLALSGSTHAIAYEVVDGPTENALSVGEPTTREHTMQVYRPPFTTLVTDAEGMTVAEQTVSGSTMELTVQIPPPTEPGRYETSISVQPYPSTLPRPWLTTLHGIHPAIAMIVSTAAAFVPGAVLYAFLFDGQRPIRRPSWRWLRRLGGDV